MVDTYLIIGLGNPGREYHETRHNVGYMVLNKLANKLSIRFTRLQSKALVATFIDKERKLILAKPQTYMNLSGQSVKGLVRFYKLTLDHIVVIHDDIDLPLGTIRIKSGGGSAGQKGIASLMDHLGTDQFIRIRIGIGRPPGQLPVADFVLDKFTRDEADKISQTLDHGVNAALELLTHGLDVAMNKFNGSQLY